METFIIWKIGAKIWAQSAQNGMLVTIRGNSWESREHSIDRVSGEFSVWIQYEGIFLQLPQFFLNSFFFKFYFIFKLYIIVLVLPNIKMNPPQVYMCSPSWTLLPPPSLYHPSGLSECTSPKHPVSCIEPGLATRFLHDILHVSMPNFFMNAGPGDMMCSYVLCLPVDLTWFQAFRKI